MNTTFTLKSSLLLLGLLFLANILIAQEVRIRPNGATTQHVLIEPLNTNGGVFLGEEAGGINTGWFNTFLGAFAGYHNTTASDNTFVGYLSGHFNTTGISNTFLGNSAGFNNTTGQQNIFIGPFAGSANTTGNYSTIIGSYAGLSATGTANTFLGQAAGNVTTTGSNNTFLGRNAGAGNTTGSGNIYIGNDAGKNETSSNKLFIHNTDAGSGSALIHGDFSSKFLLFNGSVGVNKVFTGTSLNIRSSPTDFLVLSTEDETGDEVFYVEEAGTVFVRDSLGVGTDNPEAEVHIKNGSEPRLLIQSDGTNEESGRVSLRQSNNTGADLVYDGTNANDVFAIETFIGDSSNGKKFTMDISGNVGIGAIDPKARLHVEGSGWFSSDEGSLPSGAGTGVRLFYDSQALIGNIFAYDYAAGQNIDLVLQQPGGRVSIGTTTPATGYKLSVDGKIICEELRVDLKADWPDYVFLEDYELPTLTEVKSHIIEKGHLIGVPSAEEVQTDGLLLGEMNKVLMEKVEELTLYILQQEERIQKLEQAIQK